VISLVDRIYVRGDVIMNRDGRSLWTQACSTAILSPANPPVVRVSITAPTRVGVCDDISINGGMSTGNAGRPFVYHWRFEKSDNLFLTQEDYELVANFTATFMATSSVFVPNDVLISTNGDSYTFSLTCTNWLGASGSGTRTVLRSSDALPGIALSSQTISSTITRSISVSASASAPNLVCLNSFSLGSFSFRWEKISGPPIDLVLSQQSLQLFPAYSLVPGTHFVFRATVTYDDTQQGNVLGVVTNFADLDITTTKSPLVTILSPSDSLVSISGSSGPNVTLSASLSYDPDYPDHGRAGMTFLWACSLSISGGDCLTPGVDPTTEVFVFQKYGVSIEEYYTFTLVILKDTRSGSAVSQLRFTITDVPAVSLTAPTVFSKYNPEKTLQLVGESYVPQELAMYFDTTYWSWFSPEFDVNIRENLYSPSDSSNLVLKPNVLTPGATYHFEITANFSIPGLGNGWARIAVVVNAPPSGGTCFIDNTEPTFGSYSYLWCEDWTDDDADMPFSYQFGYDDPELGFISLSLGTEMSNRYVAILPAGTINLVFYISDIYNARAVYRGLTVHIARPDTATSGALENLANELLSKADDALASGDPSAVSQIFGATVSILPSAGAGSDDSNGAAKAEAAAAIRQDLVDMIGVVLADFPVTPDMCAMLVGLLGMTTNEPSQLNPYVRQSSMNMFNETVNNLAGFGAFTIEQATTLGPTLGNIVESFSNSPVDEYDVDATAAQAEERAALGKAVAAAQQGIGTGLAAGMVVGQDVAAVELKGMLLMAGVFDRLSADTVCANGRACTTTPLAMRGPNTTDGSTPASFSMGSDAGISPDIRKSAIMTKTDENLYGGFISSPTVGLTLYNQDTGEPLAYAGGSVTIQIPLTDEHRRFFSAMRHKYGPGGIQVDSSLCQYWDDNLDMWSDEGCVMAGFNENYTECVCTHLTTFSCAFVPPVTIPDWTSLTWSNIQENPYGFIILMTFTFGIFGPIFAVAIKRDRYLDIEGLAETLDMLHGKHVPKLRPTHWNKKYRLCATKNLRQAKQTVQYGHSWLSMIYRLSSSTTSSIDRALILYTALLSGCALCAVFVEGMVNLPVCPHDDPEDKRYGWSQEECDFELWKNNFLVTIWTAVVSSGIAYFIDWAFLPTNERFHNLFLYVCEEAYLKANPNVVRDLHERPETRELMKSYLMIKHNVRLGFCGATYAFHEYLINYRHAWDVEPPDFRLSLVKELREGGFALVKDLVTLDDFKKEWNPRKYMPKEKVIGYIFCVLLSNFCWILLLTFTLQFALALEADRLKQAWYENWVVGAVQDLTYMQSLTLTLQSLFLLYFWHKILARSIVTDPAFLTRGQLMTNMIQFDALLQKKYAGMEIEMVKPQMQDSPPPPDDDMAQLQIDRKAKIAVSDDYKTQSKGSKYTAQIQEARVKNKEKAKERERIFKNDYVVRRAQSVVPTPQLNETVYEMDQF